MATLDTIGKDWLIEQIEEMTDTIVRVTPVSFSEEFRVLPESVTALPGPISFDVNPFMREIIDCCAVGSGVREVALMKGVQITWTTALETVALYYMAHITTRPIMYVTADKELADARVENNFLVMLQQSGFKDIIQSSDEGNKRKTGQTKHHIQFKGGGYMMPFGANNANKMRQVSIAVMLRDEVDGWPLLVGTVGKKDGDPIQLTKDRLSGYWDTRCIFTGSTPAEEATSKILPLYERGDQRKYMVFCIHCRFEQELRWETVNEETGMVGGIQWDYLDNGSLDIDSVRYCCQECGGEHFEIDKEKLFSPDTGAYWKPTAIPVEPSIRSYHLPALYSPIGLAPWSKCVLDYLDAYDVDRGKIKDYGKYQTFYNNVLARPFRVPGARVRFESADAHRRSVYTYGTIPNVYAAKFCDSPVLFLTCTVDLHKDNLAVAVMGWTRGARNFLIDYDRFEPRENEEDCTQISCSVWGRLRTLIEEKVYMADDGKQYRIIMTLIDSNYQGDTVNTFCSDYASGVYPIKGRDRPIKAAAIKEFSEFTTQRGTTGFNITVDHYKDRIALVLRREWYEEQGMQPRYHFNAPVDAMQKQIKELTVESRRKKVDENGNVGYVWHRPSNAKNELWDLLVYAHCAVEIIAYKICMEYFEAEAVDWAQFWGYIENEALYYEASGTVK